MIERALEVKREQHRVAKQMAKQMQAQMAEQAKQMREYEAKMRLLVEGSGRVVTSELEVTNVMAPIPVIYRSSVDSRSNDVNVQPDDDRSEDRPWISIGHKTFTSK
ncbi:hypothetical protein FH972_019851 [Carpinus fangiana]|uniref:Uncharacterized protein n=1 Tax=Carpinus fangiana TaxID=176857 RepID=A0A5N6RUX0_9ROSI|nr:hypothetical protein FH972_019851 [Carpinus fangiana]